MSASVAAIARNVEQATTSANNMVSNVSSGGIFNSVRGVLRSVSG